MSKSGGGGGREAGNPQLRTFFDVPLARPLPEAGRKLTVNLGRLGNLTFKSSPFYPEPSDSRSEKL